MVRITGNAKTSWGPPAVKALIPRDRIRLLVLLKEKVILVISGVLGTFLPLNLFLVGHVLGTERVMVQRRIINL